MEGSNRDILRGESAFTSRSAAYILIVVVNYSFAAFAPRLLPIACDFIIA
jgi:hypothetical protein